MTARRIFAGGTRCSVFGVAKKSLDEGNAGRLRPQPGRRRTFPADCRHTVPAAKCFRSSCADAGHLVVPDQVIIVAGRRQACSLIAHLFQRVGDRVVVESPGNKNVNHFDARGPEFVHVPVDELGLETDRLPNAPVSLAYVSPTRQDPIGGVMPRSRRMALIQWARDVGAYLIEDDWGIDRVIKA